MGIDRTRAYGRRAGVVALVVVAGVDALALGVATAVPSAVTGDAGRQLGDAGVQG